MLLAFLHTCNSRFICLLCALSPLIRTYYEKSIKRILKGGRKFSEANKHVHKPIMTAWTSYNVVMKVWFMMTFGWINEQGNPKEITYQSRQSYFQALLHHLFHLKVVLVILFCVGGNIGRGTSYCRRVGRRKTELLRVWLLEWPGVGMWTRL